MPSPAQCQLPHGPSQRPASPHSQSTAHIPSDKASVSAPVTGKLRHSGARRLCRTGLARGYSPSWQQPCEWDPGVLAPFPALPSSHRSPQRTPCAPHGGACPGSIPSPQDRGQLPPCTRGGRQRGARASIWLSCRDGQGHPGICCQSAPSQGASSRLGSGPCWAFGCTPLCVPRARHPAPNTKPGRALPDTSYQGWAPAALQGRGTGDALKQSWAGG